MPHSRRLRLRLLLARGSPSRSPAEGSGPAPLDAHARLPDFTSSASKSKRERIAHDREPRKAGDSERGRRPGECRLPQVRGNMKITNRGTFDLSQDPAVAVLTGSHPFHVRPFHDFIYGLDGIKPYMQSFDDWLTSAGFEDNDEEVRDSYDVTLFYTMLRGLPEGKPQACIEHMLDRGQPVFVLHHALLNYREDEWWGEIIGLPDRRFSVGYLAGFLSHRFERRPPRLGRSQ